MNLSSAINAARRAAGVEPDNVVKAQPVEEAGRLHDKIAESSGASQRAALDLCDGLTEVIKAGPESKRGRAYLAVELIDVVRNLGYSDYGMFVGAINLCRDDKSGRVLKELLSEDPQARRFRDLSGRVREAVGVLKHLHGAQFAERNEKLPAPLGHNGIDVELNKDFTEQTMLLLRAVHPLGVNMKTPSWRSAAGAGDCPAERLLILQLGGDKGNDRKPRREVGALIVNPNGDTSVVKFIPSGSRWEDVTESAVLKNGESIIVGRALSLPGDLFGLELPRSIAVPVDLKIDGANTAWSRGSFFFYRSDDGRSLIIMDRGTRSSVVISGEISDGWESWTYYPRTVIDPRGTISFGDSVAAPHHRNE